MEHSTVTPLRLVAWEVTRRCPLACKHCRGSARDEHYPDELTTKEGKKLIDSIASMGPSILILTGGEPMFRSDIYELASYASEKGLRPVLSPCGKFITPETVSKMKESGILKVSLSVDGHTEESHDHFRGIKGAFESVKQAASYLREAGMGFQINSTITKLNVEYLPELLELAKEWGADLFNPFFMVPTGRGKAIADLEIPADEYEDALKWINEQSKTDSMPIRVTCAPHYYRVARQNPPQKPVVNSPHQQTGGHPHGNGHKATGSIGCMAGQGFAFVSSTGRVQPCGFADVTCGDIREPNVDFASIYKKSELFQVLRRRSGYTGKCGACEYLKICGGCRARAEAVHGSWIAEEPHCNYIPKRLEH